MYYLAVGSRVVVGGVFLLAALGKLFGQHTFRSFVDWIRQAQVAPRRWAAQVAGAVIAAEATVAVALAFDGTAAYGLAGAGGLLVAVSATLLAGKRTRKPNTNCHCFGVVARPAGRPHLVRNCFLLAVCVVGWAASRSWPGYPPRPGLLAIAVSVGALVATLMRFQDEIMQFFRPWPGTQI